MKMCRRSSPPLPLPPLLLMPLGPAPGAEAAAQRQLLLMDAARDAACVAGGSGRRRSGAAAAAPAAGRGVCSIEGCGGCQSGGNGNPISDVWPWTVKQRGPAQISRREGAAEEKRGLRAQPLDRRPIGTRTLPEHSTASNRSARGACSHAQRRCLCPARARAFQTSSSFLCCATRIRCAPAAASSTPSPHRRRAGV